MNIRMPAAIGFYDGRSDACLRHARSLLEAASVPADLPGGRVGGIVPHAGWVYSGALAARVVGSGERRRAICCSASSVERQAQRGERLCTAKRRSIGHW